jgi:diguanylate cyclase (GGDEF)-like protein
MAIASATPRELSSVEMERLGVLGNQSSLCLQNALLHGELERLSVTDRLTELYNHGYFLQRLEEEINRSDRFSHCMSLIMLDIDDFKEFNDSYGHPRGDDVLRSVSATIRGNLREMDIAARYGGEEFVVVLPETDSSGACAVAERIRSGIGGVDEVPDGYGAHRRTVSIGVATFPQDGRSARELLEAADAAMYVAKRAGKNRVKAAG